LTARARRVPAHIHGQGSDGTAATIKVYESTTSDVTSQDGTITYTAGDHDNNGEGVNMHRFWHGTDENLYGYWGESKAAADSPLGGGGAQIHDNGVHPPSNGDRQVVLRFTIPRAGAYAIDLFGARRIPTARCGDHIDVSLIDGTGESLSVLEKLDDITKDSVLPTLENGRNTVHQLGQVAEGTHVYFAVHHSGDFDCDNNWIRFRVSQLSPTPQAQHDSSKCTDKGNAVYGEEANVASDCCDGNKGAFGDAAKCVDGFHVVSTGTTCNGGEGNAFECHLGA